MQTRIIICILLQWCCSNLTDIDESGPMLIRNIFLLLYTCRPDKPLEFMADYFSNALHGRTAVARSYRYIRLTRRNRQAFLDNLAAAYSVMARQGESKGGGLTGTEYMQLIKMLCQDFPNDVIVSLTQVSRHGILPC